MTQGIGSAVWHGTRSRFRRRNAILILVSILVVTAMVDCGGKGTFFDRNRQLVLLRTAEDEAFDPVWSPDGSTIYFISNIGAHSNLAGGPVKAIKSDGSDERLTLDGDYGSISVSPDGAKLALTAPSDGVRIDGGPLLLFDLSSHSLDTLDSQDVAVVSHFSGDGEYIYYFDGWSRFFRLDRASWVVDTIFRAEMYSDGDFDLSGDSLLAFDRGIYNLAEAREDTVLDLHQPRFCPGDPSLLLGSVGSSYDGTSELRVVNRHNGRVENLDARPYYSSAIINPCWSPDGKSIVFSSAEVRTYGLVDPITIALHYDLWMLPR